MQLANFHIIASVTKERGNRYDIKMLVQREGQKNPESPH